MLSIFQHTTHGTSRWLRTGISSLALGLGALFLSAGSAFAVPAPSIMVMDSVYESEMIPLSIYPAGVIPWNGVDDKVAGEFDFTSVNWSNYQITSAVLKLHITPKHMQVDTDEILIGSKLNGSGTNLEDPIYTNKLGIGLFTGSTSPNGTFGLSAPTLYQEAWLTLNLLLHYDANDLRSKLKSGTPGTLFVKYSDDALVHEMKLTLEADYKPVPEPASLLLLGSGMIGLAAWRMRKGTNA